MKPCVVWVLLLIAAFPLFAQNNDVIPIYIAPVTGEGSTPEDNDIIANVLAIELRAWNFKFVTEPGHAEYSLVGTLSASGTYYEEDTEGKSFLLLSLNKNGLTLYEQGAYYTSVEEANTYIPSLLRNIFANIFEIVEVVPQEEPEPVDEEAWRNKEWYTGIRVFWNPRLYHSEKTGAHLANFGFGFTLEYHFANFMAAGTGIEISSDYFTASNRANDDYHNTILQIPLIIKYVWRYGINYMHEPYLGIQFNLPLYLDTSPAIVSWQAGFQFGVKAGPGVAYADVRYSMDFGPSGLHKNRPADTRQYDRYMFYLGLGYKYDLVMPAYHAIRKWWSKTTGRPLRESLLKDPGLYGEGSPDELITEEEALDETNDETSDETLGEEFEEEPEEALEEELEEELIEDELVEDESIEDKLIEDELVGEELIEDELVEDESIEDELVEDESIEDESIEDELIEDESIEDELIEDESVKDELVEDELIEDALVEDELVEDELIEDESVKDELVEDELIEDETIEDELSEEALIEEELIEDELIEDELVEDALIEEEAAEEIF